MKLSHLFILSLRGDWIFFRSFEKDEQNLPPPDKTFFRRYSSGDKLPIFQEDNRLFASLSINDVLIVCTTSDITTSHILLLDLLSQFTQVVADFIIDVKEAVLRTNFELLFEITDMMLLNGELFECDTALLESGVMTEVKLEGDAGLEGTISKVFREIAPIQPHLSPDQANGLFVEVNEAIVGAVDQTGVLLNASVCGTVSSFAQLPRRSLLMLQLNLHGLQTGKDTRLLDNLCFGDTVDWSRLESTGTLTAEVHRGTCNILRYRLPLQPTQIPFVIMADSSLVSPHRFALNIYLVTHFNPNCFGNFLLTINLSNGNPITRVEIDAIPDNAYAFDHDFDETESLLKCKLSQVGGRTRGTLHLFLVTDNSSLLDASPLHQQNKRRGIGGSIDVSFACQKIIASHFEINGIKLLPDSGAHRFVRRTTCTSSFTVQITD